MVFLAFLTSEECLEACRRYVAPDVLAAELSRLWFDDIYVPGESYLDGLKGDRSEEAVRHFRACFSEDELAALERFHGFFELRIDMAANREHGRAFFPENDSWRALVRHAAGVLGDLETDAERLRGLLAGFVREMMDETGGRKDLGKASLRRLLHPAG